MGTILSCRWGWAGAAAALVLGLSGYACIYFQQSSGPADFYIYLANRSPAALAAEAQASCGTECKYPIAGFAVTPPQEPLWFEGHEPPHEGGGQTQQLHPARAVMEILHSGIDMSMMAVDIGSAGGSPECGPLFDGSFGKTWKGAKVDARPNDYVLSSGVKLISAKAEPPTVAKLLQDACIPQDIDLLKIDIDCYDWDVVKALLDAGFRPKVFAAEITAVFPPPVHFHVSYWPGYQWTLISTRPKDQQVLVGASLSAYSDLLRPLGYTLLAVDYYNVVYVQTKYIHLFGDIPTDDISAWRAGWYDRPERKTQPDLQKHWVNFPPMQDWMAIEDTEERFRVIEGLVGGWNGGGGELTSTLSAWDPWVWTEPVRCAHVPRDGI